MGLLPPQAAPRCKGDDSSRTPHARRSHKHHRRAPQGQHDSRDDGKYALVWEAMEGWGARHNEQVRCFPWMASRVRRWQAHRRQRTEMGGLNA